MSVSNESNESDVCEICHRELSNKFSKSRHMKLVHQTGTYTHTRTHYHCTADECPYSTLNRAGAKTHMEKCVYIRLAEQAADLQEQFHVKLEAKDEEIRQLREELVKFKK